MSEVRDPVTDPYAAPRSTTTIADDAPRARPISAWVLIVVLGIFVAIWSIGFVGVAVAFLKMKATVTNVGAMAIALLWPLFLVGLALTTIVGIFRGRRWARWVGLLAIVLLSIGMFLTPDTTKYANDAERAGGAFGRKVFMPLVMAGWFYAYGFSAKARRYFR